MEIILEEDFLSTYLAKRHVVNGSDGLERQTKSEKRFYFAKNKPIQAIPIDS